MYFRAVFLGFGCIESLVARLSKLAFGYTVTYSPELQKDTARRMYLLWQAWRSRRGGHMSIGSLSITP
jgi:hypothetical protein